MTRKTLLTLSVSATLAIISFAPTAVFAQFPPPPPMGLGGPPPIAAGGPPAFGGPPPMGPGGAPRAGFGGPAPRLGAGAGPRGDLRALGGVRAVGRDGPAVARSIQARSASVATAVPEASAMAMAGGDMVTVQPTPLEPMPAMPWQCERWLLFRQRLLLRLQAAQTHSALQLAITDSVGREDAGAAASSTSVYGSSSPGIYVHQPYSFIAQYQGWCSRPGIEILTQPLDNASSTRSFAVLSSRQFRKRCRFPSLVEKLDHETESSVGCTDNRSSTDDTRYGRGEPRDFTALLRTPTRVHRWTRIIRTGKLAAVIALGICLIVSITMCGATGAHITGPWFPLVRPKKSPRAS